MYKETIKKYILKRVESVKIVTFIILFILFVLIPLIFLYKKKGDQERTEKIVKELIKKEKRVYNLVDNTQLEIEKAIKRYQEEREKLKEKTFGTISEFKEFINEKLRKNKLELLAQYRYAKEEGGDKNEIIYEIISIPYEIKGEINNLYNFFYILENSEKLFLLNYRQMTIEYSKEDEVVAKFYITTIFFKED